ncbi:sugar nucleotidyltransferase [Rhodobacteraceae bacterium nBUS_22]
MKNVIGVVMAGGRGTRLNPVTRVINKHLLPIYQKPMIFYALSNLVLAGIKDIFIVTNPKDISTFEKLIDPIFLGSDYNLKVITQEIPNGIAEVFKLIESFRNGRDMLLHLGDNLFFGHNFITRLSSTIKTNNSTVFTYKVKNPSAFAVIKMEQNTVAKIIEKPDDFISDLIATGIYFYKDSDIKLSQQIDFSDRGELEITDMNNLIIRKSKLAVVQLQRGDIWYDCGTFDDLASATQFIKFAEERHSLQIGDLEAILASKGQSLCFV